MPSTTPLEVAYITINGVSHKASMHSHDTEKTDDNRQVWVARENLWVTKETQQARRRMTRTTCGDSAISPFSVSTASSYERTASPDLSEKEVGRMFDELREMLGGKKIFVFGDSIAEELGTFLMRGGVGFLYAYHAGMRGSSPPEIHQQVSNRHGQLLPGIKEKLDEAGLIVLTAGKNDLYKNLPVVVADEVRTLDIEPMLREKAKHLPMVYIAPARSHEIGRVDVEIANTMRRYELEETDPSFKIITCASFLDADDYTYDALHLEVKGNQKLLRAIVAAFRAIRTQLGAAGIAAPREKKHLAGSCLWIQDGHKWIGQKVLRIFPGVGPVYGRITHWLPPGEEEEGSVLFHVQMNEDGDEEDLEEEEARRAIDDFNNPPPEQVWWHSFPKWSQHAPTKDEVATALRRLLRGDLTAEQRYKVLNATTCSLLHSPKGRHYETALYQAVFYKNLGVVEALVEAGADMSHGMIALQIHHSKKISEYLRMKNAETQPPCVAPPIPVFSSPAAAPAPSASPAAASAAAAGPTAPLGAADSVDAAMKELKQLTAEYEACVGKHATHVRDREQLSEKEQVLQTSVAELDAERSRLRDRLDHAEAQIRLQQAQMQSAKREMEAEGEVVQLLRRKREAKDKIRVLKKQRTEAAEAAEAAAKAAAAKAAATLEAAARKAAEAREAEVSFWLDGLSDESD